MNILIVNPYEDLLYEKEKLVKSKYPESNIVKYTNPMLAVKYAANNKIDILFTRIDMAICNGYQVADLVVKFNKSVKVYFERE
ncbi:MAG: hypothetical protein E7207_03510 [Clostridium butyricum]|nr:hypothetical protein [Clostridium butyricum]